MPGTVHQRHDSALYRPVSAICSRSVHHNPPRPLIINLGLTKSGTTSLHHFFDCSGWCSRHDYSVVAKALVETLELHAPVMGVMEKPT